MSISDIYMAGTEEGKSANRKTDLAVTNWVSGANPLLRWIPGVFITPGTYHIVNRLDSLTYISIFGMY